uniref:Ribosomal protein S5 domain 2-like superfamily protein n=1 Tax=Pelargonium exstipulatum TaxID=59873 RepID=A0A0G4APV3_9ROSI|nr:ribosomal protein S5 domain 2-like superfamily protein [Pelargonium exstipulatum]
MLSRLIPKPSHFRLLALALSNPQSYPFSTRNPSSTSIFRPFSSDGNDNKYGKGKSFSDSWNVSRGSREDFGSFFGDESKSLTGGTDAGSWLNEGDDEGGNIFEGIDKETRADSGGGGRDGRRADRFNDLSFDEEEKDYVFRSPPRVNKASTGAHEGESLLEGDDEEDGDIFAESNKGIRSGGGAGHDWERTDGSKDWSLEEEDKDVFDLEGSGIQMESSGRPSVDYAELKKEEKELNAIIKGPNRAFGDLVAASGITDEMLDSLIVLKSFEGISGLPPLSEFQDMQSSKSKMKTAAYTRELLRQQELFKPRVRLVDENGRAYGTGRRKSSIARVWVESGEGKFFVNDKEIDVYFPMLDHRAALLRPFAETKTLGLWDVKCTVKGGGISGQVGAIQLGISRAMQNFEPGLRTLLRSGGFLTRDPRVVERKKPGRKKARKGFQWVKR